MMISKEDRKVLKTAVVNLYAWIADFELAVNSSWEMPDNTSVLFSMLDETSKRTRSTEKIQAEIDSAIFQYLDSYLKANHPSTTDRDDIEFCAFIVQWRNEVSEFLNQI